MGADEPIRRLFRVHDCSPVRCLHSNRRGPALTQLSTPCSQTKKPSAYVPDRRKRKQKAFVRNIQMNSNVKLTELDQLDDRLRTPLDI